MVEDSNRYFKTFQEHEEHAAKQADQILNLLQEQATLQAQLDDECSVTQLQALELQACRRLLRGAGRNDAKRFVACLPVMALLMCLVCLRIASGFGACTVNDC